MHDTSIPLFIPSLPLGIINTEDLVALLAVILINLSDNSLKNGVTRVSVPIGTLLPGSLTFQDIILPWITEQLSLAGVPIGNSTRISPFAGSSMKAKVYFEIIH